MRFRMPPGVVDMREVMMVMRVLDDDLLLESLSVYLTEREKYLLKVKAAQDQTTMRRIVRTMIRAAVGLPALDG